VSATNGYLDVMAKSPEAVFELGLTDVIKLSLRDQGKLGLTDRQKGSRVTLTKTHLHDRARDALSQFGLHDEAGIKPQLAQNALPRGRNMSVHDNTRFLAFAFSDSIFLTSASRASMVSLSRFGKARPCVDFFLKQ
jgi:hypothetical protein